MRGILKRLKFGIRDESGDALLIGALGMMMIVAFAALAIDVGQLRLEKRRLQAAVDAAALAGALEASNCGSTYACTNMQTAAKQALAENGFPTSGTTVVKNCTTSNAGGLILWVNQGPCELGSTTNDPNYGSTKYVEAEIKYPQTTTFARAVGIPSETITVRSEAGEGNASACFYTSTLPSQRSGTGMLLNGGTISASCGIMDDATDGNALESDSGTFTTTSFSVAGGWSPDNGGTFTPTPKTEVATVTDPLSYLTAPGQGTVQQSGNYVPANGATLQPGAYLGGININSGVSVTLAAGTYYLNGSINDGGTITGTSGVTIYFNSGSLTMNSGSTAQLVAPTSGTYAGILIYQSSSDSTSMILDGNSTSKWQGAIYAPDAQLTFNSTGNAAAYTIIDVGSVIVNSGADLVMGNNYSSLSGGSPIKGGSAVLAE
jgi:Flp pilus assembly protein TadG